MAAQVRPHVVLQIAASIDGRITFGPGLTQFDKHPAEQCLPEGGPLWQEIDAKIEADWHPQGTLMGSRTVMREGNPLRELPPPDGPVEALHEDFLPADIVMRTTHWLILPDGLGRGRSGYKGTETPGRHMIHLVAQDTPDAYLAFLRHTGIPYLIGGRRHADLAGALAKLHATLGVRAVKLYGGGTLNGVMLRLGLIDEIHLILWPVMIGGDATPTLADCLDLRPDELPTKLQLITAKPQADGQVWLHYRVRWVADGT